VVKNFQPEEVFGKKFYRPSGKEIVSCGFKKDGEYFVGEQGDKPEGFCMWVWRDLYKDLSVLVFGGNFWRKEKGTIHTSCTDGRKPVVFKLERIE